MITTAAYVPPPTVAKSSQGLETASKISSSTLLAKAQREWSAVVAAQRSPQFTYSTTLDKPVRTTPLVRRATPQRSAADRSLDAAYWFHPSIHNWGNIGWRGRFHAFFAPLATYIIDQTSYSGLDVRKLLHDNTTFFPQGASVLDLCCGTGFSTAKGAIGVDTSNCMIDVARARRPDALFRLGNAESYGESRSFDVVSCMFGTHEMPSVGRRRVLRNAMRVAKRAVLFVDIDPDFEATLRAKPMQGAGFLSGEPYVLDYLSSFDDDVASCVPVRIAAPGIGWRVTRHAILQKHVVAWHLERID